MADTAQINNINISKALNGYIVNVDGRQYIAEDIAAAGGIVAQIVAGEDPAA